MYVSLQKNVHFCCNRAFLTVQSRSLFLFNNVHSFAFVNYIHLLLLFITSFLLFSSITL